MQILKTLKRWLLPVSKTWSSLTDIFQPRGYVEARLIYAHGPKKGQVARVERGRNVITGFLQTAPGEVMSGRDLMRRFLVRDVDGGLSDDTYKISQMELGSGNTAEASSDTDLDTRLDVSYTPRKDITSVVFDTDNTYVTFYCEFDEGEVNTTLAEAVLWNQSTNNGGPFGTTGEGGDLIARKTFRQFSKTSDFILQLRWTIRI